MKTYLLLDGHFLCHRAKYTTGGISGLSFDGEPTGIAFGILRDAELLTDLFGASVVVWAFDWGGPGLRSQVSPTYKIKRWTREMTEEEEIAHEMFKKEVRRLQSDLLPALGYRNVYRVRGYEADDILAASAERIDTDDEAIIVTSDNDLWQCVRTNVRCYNPITKKMTTEASFREEWHLEPVMWAHIKAMAGCPGDGVEGIAGIGEKTAAGWYTGKLKPTSKKHQLISQNLKVANDNLPLVKLPYPGLELPEIRDDEVTESRRIRVQQELGIRPRRYAKKEKKMVGRGGFELDD